MKTFKQFFIEEFSEDACWPASDGDRVMQITNKGEIRRVPKMHGSTYYIDSNHFLHNSKGPAIITHEVCTSREDCRLKQAAVSYWKHGKLHRVDGPADIGATWERYVLDSKDYTKEKFEQITKNIDKENIDDVVGLNDLF